MATTETAILALLAGIGVGTVFYGGLWWTVRKGITSRQPAVLFLGSFLARMAAVVPVLFLISQGRLERLALGLLGFFAARTAIVRHLRPRALSDSQRVASSPHGSRLSPAPGGGRGVRTEDAS